MSARYSDRKIAAALYLFVGGFFALVIVVLATSWGQGGLGQLLSVANETRNAVAYLIVLLLFSFATALFLLMPRWLSTERLLGVTRTALILLIAGLYFAPPAAVLSTFPFWFLYRAQRAYPGDGDVTA